MDNIKNLSLLSDDALLIATKAAAKKEQSATLSLLHHLNEVKVRRLHALRGYKGLHSYTEQELGYSSSEATIRVNAAELLFAVKETEDFLETRELTLTSAAQLQTFFKANKKYDPAKKLELVKKCQGLPKLKIEKILLAEAGVNTPPRESQRQVTPDLCELKFCVTDETLDKIKKIKDIKGQMSLAQIFERAVTGYLETLQKPTKKSALPKSKLGAPKSQQDGHDASQQIYQSTQPSPGQPIEGKSSNTALVNPEPVRTSSKRYIPASLKRYVYARSGGRCEYIDPKTGRRCNSTYRLQYEHAIPFSCGGETSPQNLLHYCQAHNQLSALAQFGVKKMAPYFTLGAARR